MDSISEAVSRLQNCGLKCGYIEKEQEIRGGINPRTVDGIKLISNSFSIRYRENKWIFHTMLRQLSLEQTFNNLSEAVDFVCKLYETKLDFADAITIEQSIHRLSKSGLTVRFIHTYEPGYIYGGTIREFHETLDEEIFADGFGINRQGRIYIVSKRDEQNRVHVFHTENLEEAVNHVLKLYGLAEG
jgi:hypothetical protein